jgi:5-methylcytosine-specific restriction protein A
VCRYFLDNQKQQPGGRHRPHVNLVVRLDEDGLEGGIVAGPSLPKGVLERYCCDSAVHRVLTDGRSAIIDVGTATRTLTAALWMALVLRDGHCRFPGCDRPATWCDGHHVRWFSHGGPTRLDNLVLPCRRHHKRLHQTGWSAKLLPDGTFEVTDPGGIVRASHPPGTLQPFP